MYHDILEGQSFLHHHHVSKRDNHHPHLLIFSCKIMMALTLSTTEHLLTKGEVALLSTLLSAYLHVLFSNHWMYRDDILYHGVKRVRNGFIWLKIMTQSWTPVNLVMNFKTASNVRNFLTTWGPNSSSRTLLQLLSKVIKALF
jgi:hypothetical protein